MRAASRFTMDFDLERHYRRESDNEFQPVFQPIAILGMDRFTRKV
jgi:hypothetical protein